MQISPGNGNGNAYGHGHSDSDDFVANQVIWDKTGQDFQFNEIQVYTYASGDECVNLEYDPNLSGADQYRIVDNIACDDRAKTLCQKECGAGEGKVA